MYGQPHLLIRVALGGALLVATLSFALRGEVDRSIQIASQPSPLKRANMNAPLADPDRLKSTLGPHLEAASEPREAYPSHEMMDSPETVDPKIGSWLWPQLNPVILTDGQATVRLQGHDPAAPQPLQLWHIREGQKAEIIAHSQSLEDGGFDFGRIVVPQSGLRVVVTPLDLSPYSVRSQAIKRPQPSPPHLSVEYESQGLTARITPARLEGEILITNEFNETVARQRVETGPAEITINPEELHQALSITHLLPNGQETKPFQFHTAHPL